MRWWWENYSDCQYDGDYFILALTDYSHCLYCFVFPYNLSGICSILFSSMVVSFLCSFFRNCLFDPYMGNGISFFLCLIFSATENLILIYFLRLCPLALPLSEAPTPTSFHFIGFHVSFSHSLYNLVLNTCIGQDLCVTCLNEGKELHPFTAKRLW